MKRSEHEKRKCFFKRSYVGKNILSWRGVKCEGQIDRTAPVNAVGVYSLNYTLVLLPIRGKQSIEKSILKLTINLPALAEVSLPLKSQSL